MRMMLRFDVPVETGNDGIRDGTLPKTLQKVMEAVHPEAAYFLANEGQRCGLIFFDLDDVSKIPSIAEPLFMNLNAAVEFTPVMNQDDLEKGLAAVH